MEMSWYKSRTDIIWSEGLIEPTFHVCNIVHDAINSVGSMHELMKKSAVNSVSIVMEYWLSCGLNAMLTHPLIRLQKYTNIKPWIAGSKLNYVYHINVKWSRSLTRKTNARSWTRAQVEQGLPSRGKPWQQADHLTYRGYFWRFYVKSFKI